jgi:RNA polymerase sigma-70 factor (ECF subfamily)
MATFDASLHPFPRLGDEAVGRARTDAELVRDARAGSAAAWSALFERHWPMALRAAYLILHDTAAAEDAAQDGFLAALRALHRFDRSRPFAPWLHRIVVNRAIDQARRPARRSEVAAEHGPEPSAEPAAAPDDRLMAALRALPPDQRAVVVLRHLLELTPGEIATTLGLPRGTVNSRLRRALDRLSEELA